MPQQAHMSLESAGAALVHRLGGQWNERGGMCRCPAHADKTPSLSVRVGSRALLFKCFAGCTIDEIFRALRANQIALPQTMDEPLEPSRSTDNGGPARRLWTSARPIMETLAQDYLQSRSIFTGSPALRFQPATPIGAGRTVQFRPALLAAITRDRDVLAVQRIFLDGAGRLAKDMGKPKRSLGRPLDGAVALSRAGPILGLAEGVESAMSAAMLLGIPVWAALGAERLDQLLLPPIARRIILLADNDLAGIRAVARSLVRYTSADRRVEPLWPPARFNDWNDFHRAEGERARGWVRVAA